MHIQLAPDEKIARAFFRTRADDLEYFSRLRSTDFERRAPAGKREENGISMFRLGYIDVEAMLARIIGKARPGKFIGYAICDAIVLQEHLLQFNATNDSDAHVSVRCPTCNVETDLDVACDPISGQCPFRKEQLYFSEKLVSLFIVQMVATPVESLM